MDQPASQKCVGRIWKMVDVPRHAACTYIGRLSADLYRIDCEMLAVDDMYIRTLYSELLLRVMCFASPITETAKTSTAIIRLFLSRTNLEGRPREHCPVAYKRLGTWMVVKWKLRLPRRQIRRAFQDTLKQPRRLSIQTESAYTQI